MSSPLSRLRTALVLGLAAAASLVLPAHADEPTPAPKPAERSATTWQARAKAETGATTTEQAPRLQVMASTEETNAVARLNSHRARAGLAPVKLVGVPGAVINHAKYLDQNWDVTGLNPFTEDPNLPGWTESGSAVADEIWPGWTSSGTYSQVIDEWMSDPAARFWELLEPTTTSVAFTRQGTVVLAWFQHSSSATASVPVTFPQGPNFSLRAMHADVAPYYTQGCGTQQGWGFPITFQWPSDQFTDMYVNTVDLRVDGAPVNACVVNNSLGASLPGQVVIIPGVVPAAGSHVSVGVEVTGYNADGTGTQVLQAGSDFTHWAPATATPGDQTGDNTGDILAVNNDGNLFLYKGRQPGTVGHGFQIGRGWNEFTWFAHSPDVNGDGREDLIGRRADGHLYLYFGQGMGSYTAGRKVGQNWGALRNLTVVGDMTGDGTPEVIGIGPEGNLYRYTLTANGFVGASLIGRNWQGIALTTSVGSFNANTDKYADLIAVGGNGMLYVYYSGRGGNFIQTAVIGQGWTGFTALFSPGDVTGDRLPDLFGRRADGVLFSYQNRVGAWGAARQAGTGWNGMRLFG